MFFKGSCRSSVNCSKKWSHVVWGCIHGCDQGVRKGWWNRGRWWGHRLEESYIHFAYYVHWHAGQPGPVQKYMSFKKNYLLCLLWDYELYFTISNNSRWLTMSFSVSNGDYEKIYSYIWYIIATLWNYGHNISGGLQWNYQHYIGYVGLYSNLTFSWCDVWRMFERHSNSTWTQFELLWYKWTPMD